MLGPWVLCPASAAQILALRHAILRPGLPQDVARFVGDDAADTRHFGAFVDDLNVGCLSLMQAPWQGRPALQLRGMAVASAWQGRGLGGRLLAFALAECASPLVWCNARLGAVEFYERHGFLSVGDVFDIPGVGPHKKLLRACQTSDETSQTRESG